MTYKAKYAIGVDFGTESGRAVLVDVADGREVATAVYPYSHGVIDEKLPIPGEEIRLEPDWALQDPQDYIRTFQNTIPASAQAVKSETGRCDRHRDRFHCLHDAAGKAGWYTVVRPAGVPQAATRLG